MLMSRSSGVPARIASCATVPATPTAASTSRAGRGRVARQVALGEPDRADVETRAEVAGDEFGRAAADVQQQCAGGEGAKSAAGQVCFLLAREEARDEPVRPLDLAEERLAVLRVAHGARCDCECALGAERLELAPEVG